DVLEQLGPRLPDQIDLPCKRRGVRARVVDGELVAERIEIDASEPFECVELRGVRQTAPVPPEPLVEADGVDDERVALPMADGVAVVGGLGFLRVLPPVQVN